ncbi:O-antigen ligase family protein [Fodinibius sp. AD559]|uniref:O-antigen ligase family protein n=1 Tax=Fodinibius sp. AD559 TaxID=3424179 RepID=UPI004046A7D8
MSSTVVYTGLGKLTLDNSQMAAIKFLVILLLPIFGGIFHTACYLLVAAWCLLGVRRSLEGLTLLWLLTYLNPGIYSLSSLEGFLRWLPLFASAFTVMRVGFFTRDYNIPRAVVWLIVYTIGIMVMAFISSRLPLVSLFKVLSFCIGVMTILMGFQIESDNNKYWEAWFTTLLQTLLLVSLPLIVLEWGYTRNGTGFQGILNHPQAFGPVIALLLSWFFANRVSKDNQSLWFWFIMAVGSISIIASESRAALLVFGGGVIISGFVSVFKNKKIIESINIKVAAVLVPIVGAIMIAGIIYSGSIIDATSEFVFKRNSITVEQAFEKSRGFLITQSMGNFYKNPILGIGFGVPSLPSEVYITRDPLFGLPIGAPIEKGFLYSAILEETGLVGGLLFLTFMASFFVPILSKNIVFPSLVIFIGVLLFNIAEAALLSIGGNGLIMWLLLGYARISNG